MLAFLPGSRALSDGPPWRAPSGNLIPAPAAPELLPYEERWSVMSQASYWMCLYMHITSDNQYTPCIYVYIHLFISICIYIYFYLIYKSYKVYWRGPQTCVYCSVSPRGFGSDGFNHQQIREEPGGGRGLIIQWPTVVHATAYVVELWEENSGIPERFHRCLENFLELWDSQPSNQRVCLQRGSVCQTT